MIVIENGSKGEEEMSLTVNPLTVPITLIVYVYAKEAEVIDTYIDQIDRAIWAAVDTFKTYGLYLKEVTDNDNILFDDANKNRLHGKSSSVTFELL